jgi:hypothetical protein
MARVSRDRAGVPVIAAYHYIRGVRFSRRARIPNVVAHHGGHVGVFRSLCCGGGLCLGSFYAASACLSSCSIYPSAVCGPLILVAISLVREPNPSVLPTNPTNMTTGTIIIVAALFTISESIQAQAPNGGNQTISVAQLVAAQCPKFTSQLVDRPELKLILSQRPVDVSAVCACTQRSYLADARLQKALDVDDQTLVERMKEERMRAYLTMRLMASVLGCLTPELERALAATPPTK